MTRADGTNSGAVARFAHDVMATTFQVLIAGESYEYARSAAAEVFRLWDRLEGLLSRFVECSDIMRINRLERGGAARVGIEAFTCLQCAAAMTEQTNGAFDPAVGAFTKGGTRRATNTPVGMRHVALDEETFTVRMLAEGVELDLGGIAKGYALDEAAALLGDWGIRAALLCASESTVLALEPPPGQPGWRVGGPEGAPIWLCNRALSGSGTAVKGGHILDPRTLAPVQERVAAWASCPSATEADALSTAFMVMSLHEVEAYCRAHPDVGAVCCAPADGRDTYHPFGHPF